MVALDIFRSPSVWHAPIARSLLAGGLLCAPIVQRPCTIAPTVATDLRYIRAWASDGPSSSCVSAYPHDARQTRPVIQNCFFQIALFGYFGNQIVTKGLARFAQVRNSVYPCFVALLVVISQLGVFATFGHYEPFPL